LKLPVISGKEALKALERAGFVVVRQRGSHVRIKKVTSESVIKITIPIHETLDRGTLKGTQKCGSNCRGICWFIIDFFYGHYAHHYIRICLHHS
jgi:predicted RNA binding protein YcfA (HicA-like mRNA interferase family)